MALKVENESIRLIMIKNGIDPDEIRSFLEDQVSFNRNSNKDLRELLGEEEYYKREIIYTKVESFILKLKQ